MKDKPKTYGVIRNLIRYFKANEEQPCLDEINDAWSSVSLKIREDDRTIARKRRTISWITASAAAVVIIVLGIGVTFKLNTGDDISEIASELAKIQVDDDEIKLVVSSKEIVPLKENATVTYAEDGSILVDEQKVIPQITIKDDPGNNYNQLIVPKGKYTHLQLSDGSKLHVNSGSKLVYPRIFSKNRREIYVDGEVFINVTKDESAPFIVKTENFEIEVFGTSFNINAYSEDTRAEVVLVDGVIQLKDKSKNRTKLAPNELAIIHIGHIQSKQTVDVYNYIAWTQGLLVLDATPLSSVLQRLERYYGIDIQFDPVVKDLPMYGSLDLNHPLPEVLQRLSVTAPIDYKETESGFYINKRDQ